MDTRIIKSVYIKRFRSFDAVNIAADKLNIFSGKNNAGKSNILRALNLFFNSCSNYNIPYDHKADYNKAFRGDAGGKRDIQITVNFFPTGKGALQYDFSITKFFSEGSITPKVTYSSSNDKINDRLINGDGNISRQFTAFLNKIEYLYVPAVRDKNFIRNILLRYEQIIKSDTARGANFDNAVAKLSDTLRASSIGISDDLRDYIDIPAMASLSATVTDVLGAIEINVLSGVQMRNKAKNGTKGEIKDIPISLFSSGDGVIMAYLVYFLSYLTHNSPKKFIWGFEEPENSLEYSKVQTLAEQFYERFTKDAQIFITTHSPAFINLKGQEGVILYRVYTLPLPTKDLEQSIPDRRPTRVTNIDDLPRQLNLFKSSPQIIDTLEQELHFAEQSSEIERFASDIRRYQENLEKERLRFIKAYSNVFPDKIFICEDDTSKNFWTSLLAKSGVENVAVIPSHGCCNTTIENWIIVQMEQKGGYFPIVLREIDRDGLLDNQIDYLVKEMEQKFSKNFTYKYLPLPVNEIENFLLLDAKLELSQQQERELCKALMKTSSARMRDCFKMFGGTDVFPNPSCDHFMDLICEIQSTAITDPAELLPGKDILRVLHNTQVTHDLRYLCDTHFQKLPPLLQEYAINVKGFFCNKE